MTDMHWGYCPFCGATDNFDIDSESLYNRIRETYHTDPCLGIRCRSCYCQLMVYHEENCGEQTYQNMMEILNKKWNSRVNRFTV